MAAIQHILAANQQRRRARSQMVCINAYVRQHFSPLNMLSDLAVQSKYRLPRVEIQRLITLVSPYIQRATCCNFALSPEVQLLAALRFFAVGSFLEVVGDGTGLSKSSVSRSVAAVTPILLRHARTHIRMPTTRVHALSPHLCTLFFGLALELLPLLSYSTPVSQATGTRGGHLLGYGLPDSVL